MKNVGKNAERINGRKNQMYKVVKRPMQGDEMQLARKMARINVERS